ncbi:MAG: hypothetical protein FI729_01530 [SAR202 cluster bacterium]|nr:hypothetical protein [SAR202 cluster bacterium]|tara:strand:- start:880 stop:1977 length:1098 start_codon:yes stop_codon:yes gene_type:complete
MSLLVNKSINILISFAAVFVLFFCGVHLVYADHFTDDYIESEKDKLESQFEAGLIDGEEDYQIKLEFLLEELYKDHESVEYKSPFQEKKEERSGTGLFGVVVPAIIIGYFLLRMRNRRSQNTVVESEPYRSRSSSDLENESASRETVEEIEEPNMVIERDPYQDPNLPDIQNESSGNSWREKLRDKSRDDMVQYLNATGVKATMSERGRVEENIRSGRFHRSLGLIDIEEDVINWINVVRIKSRDKNGPSRYRTVFAIPDATVPLEHEALKVATVRKKSFPIFGKVVGIHWQAEEKLNPLVELFAKDEEIEALVKEVGDVQIHTHPGIFQGWTIEILTVGSVFEPHEVHWNVIHKIADYLISSPR